jgi:hypothetical protein
MYSGLYDGNIPSIGRPDVEIPLTRVDKDLTCIVGRTWGWGRLFVLSRQARTENRKAEQLTESEALGSVRVYAGLGVRK